MKTFSSLLTTGIFIILFSAPIFAQDDIECLDCHDNLIENSIHFEIVECADCHSDVIDEDHIDEGAAKVNCGSCHDDFAELQKTDIHHRLQLGKKAPECKTCHGSHEIKSPSESKNIPKDYCQTCHGDKVIMANPFHTKAVSGDVCADCHDTEEHKTDLTLSVHNNLQCADCHNYVSNNLENHPDNLTMSQKADCYLCHSNVAVEHRESIHGISLVEGIDEAATCWSCHGSHDIVKIENPESRVSPINLPYTCGTCHDDPEFIEKFNLSTSGPASSFEKSVHGLLVNGHSINAPSCSDCHGVHDIKNRIQPGSTISSFNIPDLCGECHTEITEEYKQSIHWVAAKRGVKLAPVCNDCHSEHGIQAINTSNKKEEIKKIQQETCLQCHQSPMLTRKYGVGDASMQYQDSYHGLAVLRGDDDAAFCIDCHDVHKILPSHNPESTVSDSNVTETCQTCHEDATDVFAKSYSHVTESMEAQSIEGWVKTIYFWFVVAVIGGMMLHNLLIFVFEIRKRRKKSKNEIKIPRFTKNEVIQHVFLFTSFFTLAITGFALKYPDSFWADGLYSLGMTETIRQYTHRAAAVVMIILSLYHLSYLLFTRRGRDVLLNMLPKFDDVKNAYFTILYYLKLKKEKPINDKYDYTEKAEYWALVWGTIVMGVTGFILWFPTIVGDWAPIWFIKVSEIIHFYEAILATLAIFIWHWFFVIFHPREYPMSFTWIDGKMSLDNYRHHHELHFRKLLLQWHLYKNGQLEKKELKHSTELFMKTLEDNGLNPDDIFQAEINKDPVLRRWMEDQIEAAEEKK